MVSAMRFAVIPTRGDRPDDLARCLASITNQVDDIVIVDNSDIGGYDEFAIVHEHHCFVLHRPMQPPNLSWLWNEGISAAHEMAAGEGSEAWVAVLNEHEMAAGEGSEAWVAVLNDDAVVPEGWFDAVESAMKTTGAVAGSSGYLLGPMLRDQFRHITTPINHVADRLQGWAFILAPKGPMANEDLRWWFGDTAIDMEARRNGGTVLISGYEVGNTRANSTTNGVLAEQAGRDRATYESIYGPITWWPGG